MSTFVTVPNRAGRIPASATKIMYVSTNGLGKKVAVSGYFLQPSRPWTGPGSRPLVSYGPGAHGMGDQCAPSRLVSAPNLAFPGGPMAEIEALITYNLLSRGYGVVSTDYIGLGTPGDHTFAMRVDQGDAVIDAARAALQLPGVNPRTKVALAGYSQGGAATAAAAELIDRYAPELARQVVGIYAGGAPTDLRSLLNHLDGQRLGGTIGWAIDGAMALYPDMAQKIPPLLNPEGKRNRESCSRTMYPGDNRTRFPEVEHLDGQWQDDWRDHRLHSSAGRTRQRTEGRHEQADRHPDSAVQQPC